MPTVAFAEPRNIAATKSSILPQEKPTRQIIREEIQRQKELDKLESKYEAGEISKFEYVIGKALLNMPNPVMYCEVQPKYSTTA